MERTPFDELYSGADPPPHLKKQVMESIRIARLMVDLGELFAINPSRIAGDVLKSDGHLDENNAKEI